MRVDGELVPVLEVPARLRFAIVARIKIMAELDISEHRKPQDGKIDFARFGGPAVELRVVTVPTARARRRGAAPARRAQTDGAGADRPGRRELAALRSVIAKALRPDPHLRPHRLRQDHHAAFGAARHQHRRPQDLDGRGSGGDHAGRAAPGAGQCAHRLDLRRGDAHLPARRPDVIMIGEMRDEETARIAVEASLTGHLVLSTLHTNSAPESIARLLEIGLDPTTSPIRCWPSWRSAWCAVPALLRERDRRRGTNSMRWPRNTSVRAARRGAHAACANAGAPCTAMRAAASACAPARLRPLRRHGLSRPHGHPRADAGRRRRAPADPPPRRCRRAAGRGAGTGMKTLRQDGIAKVLAGRTDLAEVLAATNA